jgi:DNA-directed RNA polymerase subunit omega
MIHPSYVDLMQVVNKGVEEGETPVINSRYAIVMATAKRARQIVDGDEPLIDVPEGEKPLSIAVEELNQEKIRILADNEPDEEDEAEPAEEDDEVFEEETVEEYSEGDDVTE